MFILDGKKCVICKNCPRYFVNEDGKIFALYHKLKGPFGEVKQSVKENRLGSYMRVELSKDGSLRKFSVHRLVAEAFHLNPDNKPQVNHIDANKQNNHPSNLEWCTAKENSAHRDLLNLRKYSKNIDKRPWVRGSKNKSSKLNEKQVLEIKMLLSSNMTGTQIAEKYGVSTSTIKGIRSGRSWGWLVGN